MSIITSSQQKSLASKYGSTHTLNELVEIDHKNPTWYRVLKHGDDFSNTCALCLGEVARKAVQKERKNLLMNELLGETVMIRAKGYKTMRKAIVEVKACDAGGAAEESHYIYFNYEEENRGQRIDQIQRLDVIIEGERLNVWDDGVSDLSTWEQEKMSTSARPCDNKYETDLEISNS